MGVENVLKPFSHFSGLLCVHLVVEMPFQSKIVSRALKIMAFGIVCIV